MEFFVLNCNPKEGFVGENTRFFIRFGWSKERCLAKIAETDVSVANNLNFRSIDLGLSEELVIDERMENLTNLIRRVLHVNNDEEELEIRQQFQNLINNTSVISVKKEQIIGSLPTAVIDKAYYAYLERAHKETLTKCVVCMECFVIDDKIKTMPCCYKVTSSHLSCSLH